MKPIIKVLPSVCDPCEIDNEIANILKLNNKSEEVKCLAMSGANAISTSNNGLFGTCRLVTVLEKPFLAPNGTSIIGAATSIRLYMHSGSLQEIMEPSGNLWQLAGEIIIPNILTTLLKEAKERKPSFEMNEDDFN